MAPSPVLARSGATMRVVVRARLGTPRRRPALGALPPRPAPLPRWGGAVLPRSDRHWPFLLKVISVLVVKVQEEINCLELAFLKCQLPGPWSLGREEVD